MLIRRSFASLAIVVLIGAVAGSSPSAGNAAGPLVWVWPGCAAQQGRPPANDKLQDCIDGASPGDSIGLSTNQSISERAIVEKSLTLFGSPGFQPKLFEVFVFTATATTLSVAVRDLTISSDIRGRFITGSGHAFTIDDVTVDPGGLGLSPAVEVEAAVPIAVSATRSRFNIGGTNETTGITLFAHHASGVVTLSVIGDQISGHDNSNSSSGIELILQGSGTTRANLMNNTIWDVAGCNCGGSAGIFINPQENAVADVNVIGNTIHHSRTSGINVRNDSLAGGHVGARRLQQHLLDRGEHGNHVGQLEGVVARLSPAPGNNDFYGNGRPNALEGRSLGTGNIQVAPGYASGGTGDLRIFGNPALVDRGITCSPGGVADPDAAGLHRLAGASVDIGAYEAGGRPQAA